MRKFGKLSDACVVIAGQSPEGSAYNSENDGLEFHQGKKAFGKYYLEPSGVWTRVITKVAEPGDILMSVRAPVGPTNITDRKICIGRGLAAIRSKNNSLPAFVLYYLKYFERHIEGAEGAVFNSINKKQIEDLRFPLLEKNEQERIVAYLDTQFAKIDAMKANAAKALAEAKALFQAALTEAMTPKEGWKEKKLGNCCEIARGGSPRPINKYITEDEDGVNWIKIGDTEIGGKYIYKTKEKIVKEGIRHSRYVEDGDFLLSNSMSFGRPYILRTNGCIHDGWLVIRKYQDTFDQDYLYYLLSSSNVKKQFEENARGSTVRNLNTDSVSKTIVFIPPSIKTQFEIVNKLSTLQSKVAALEANYTQTVAECDALKQALLREVFE